MGWVGPIIKLHNNKRQSLGLEWSMSKVGTPPSHNYDKPHELVASNNKNNKQNEKRLVDMFAPRNGYTWYTTHFCVQYCKLHYLNIYSRNI